VSGQAEVQRLSDEVHARTRELLGASLPSYCRLKVEAAARRLADEVAARFVYPPDSSRTSFVRAAIGAWARGTDEWTDPDPTRLLQMLGPVDLPYRERRLLFLLAGINELYPAVGAGAGGPTRADLDGLKARAWDFLAELRSLPGRVIERMDVETGFLSSTSIDPLLLASPEQFAEQHAEDFVQLFKVYREALTSALGDGSAPLWEAFQEGTSSWPERDRRGLLSRYLGFPLWDGLIFPTVALSGLPQFTPIGVTQFSPRTAAALPTPEGGKLRGTSLHHFAAFLKPEWRENDYLWGRLDGVELILRTLRDAGSATPPAEATTAPPSPDAVRSAGGPILASGLRAVLDAESELTRIAPTRQRLAEQVARLETG
jgi:hypothetical protein